MIRENLIAIKSALPSHVTLVAVSKTKPVSDLMEAYNAGQRVFGENKVQEMAEKYEQMPKDTEWHMIGHVQSNKVKYMAPFVGLVHGVDSLRLLQEIDRQGQKNNRIIDCLLQMHIAKEDTKFGLNENELMELITARVFANLKYIRVCGLMGMATFTDDQEQVKKEFQFLKLVFDRLTTMPQTENFAPEILSMGMSDDYPLAIDCGSTMVRIGSSIFGRRK
ncbi:MAG TPA: YggS family pyridoxal phosphate-dependent enzyme [Flavobacterium sp.]|jgi:hypothetical protein